MPIAGPPPRARADPGTGARPQAGRGCARFAPAPLDVGGLLDAVSTRLAGSYLDLGLVPGNRIASLMPNRTELLVHYLACMKCGLAGIAIDEDYGMTEIGIAAVTPPRRSSTAGWIPVT
jgi:long-chain acyl-CoA synthetase